MRDYNFLQKKAITYPRTAGMISLAVGSYFAYTYICKPYVSIVAKEPAVNISLFGALLGISLPVIGLIFLLFGNRYAPALFMHPTDLPVTEKIMFYGITAVVVGASMLIFITWLSSHGYELL